MWKPPCALARAALAVLLTALLLPWAAVTPVSAATSTSFSPTVVALPTVGSSATITVSVVGVAANTIGAQIGIVHPSNFTVTSPSCTGIFAGAFAPAPAPQPYGTLLACLFTPPTVVSGTSGNVLTFVLTRTGPTPATATISFQPPDQPFGTLFVHIDQTSEGPGTTNTLQVVAEFTPTPSPSPTLTPTATATATATLTPTATATPSPTLIPVATLTPTPTGACATTGTATLTPVGSSGVAGTVTLTRTGSASVTAQLTGLAPGTAVTLNIPTTLGTATITGTAPTVTGTTLGNPLGGGTITVLVRENTVAQGTIVCAPPAPPVPPLPPPQPPPPPIVLPPPPQPLIPAPPAMPAAAPPVLPEVPVIPEADSLALLLGGLAVLGGGGLLALWRRRR
jgi:hypothetical protein